MPLPPLHVHLGDLVAHMAKTGFNSKAKKFHPGIFKTKPSEWYKVLELLAIRNELWC